MRPIIVLDVDGVLNPEDHSQPSSEWKWQPVIKSSRMSGELDLLLSREMGRALMALGAEIYWLSHWAKYDDFCTTEIGPLTGIKGKVLPMDRPKMSDGYWKNKALEKLLRDEGPLVIWVDDDAHIPHPRIEFDPHGRLFVIKTDQAVGLTRKQLAEIKYACENSQGFNRRVLVRGQKYV